ncbi:Deoxyuridine 5'-triphosphate nucleotidohydrolase [compost metagenome]
MWQASIKYYSEWEQKERENGETQPKIFYGTPFAAGIDIPFYDPEVEQVTIKPGQRVMLKTGVYMEMPEHLLGFLDSRSSTSKLLLDLLCRTIDCDYRGNIRLVVTNVGEKDVTVVRGDYLFQMILLPRIQGILTSVNSVEELSETVRAADGFGSTGNSQVAGGKNE